MTVKVLGTLTLTFSRREREPIETPCSTQIKTAGIHEPGGLAFCCRMKSAGEEVELLALAVDYRIGVEAQPAVEDGRVGGGRRSACPMAQLVACWLKVPPPV